VKKTVGKLKKMWYDMSIRVKRGKALPGE